jgi:hypothetical protein
LRPERNTRELTSKKMTKTKMRKFRKDKNSGIIV